MYLRLLAVALAGSAVLTLHAASARSQCPGPEATTSLLPGQAGFFFDPLGLQACSAGPLMLDTNVYLVAAVPKGGIAAFYSPSLQLSNTLFDAGPQPFDLDYASVGIADYCQGWIPADDVPCPSDGKDVIVLGRYVIRPTAHGTICAESLYCGGIAGPVSWTAGAPTCQEYADTGFSAVDTTLQMFDVQDDCLAYLDPTVATTNDSWSAVRARF